MIPLYPHIPRTICRPNGAPNRPTRVVVSPKLASPPAEQMGIATVAPNPRVVASRSLARPRLNLECSGISHVTCWRPIIARRHPCCLIRWRMVRGQSRSMHRTSRCAWWIARYFTHVNACVRGSSSMGYQPLDEVKRVAERLDYRRSKALAMLIAAGFGA